MYCKYIGKHKLNRLCHFSTDASSRPQCSDFHESHNTISVLSLRHYTTALYGFNG